MELLLTIKVNVDDQREADILCDAAFSGQAEQVLKMGLLYGSSVGAGAGLSSPQSQQRQKDREVEQSTVLHRNVAEATNVDIVATERRERPKGLLGVKKMRRN